MSTATTPHPIFASLHPIFAAAVDPGNSRYDISTPWIDGDHVHATNGHIAVRIPRAAVAVPDDAFPAAKARRVNIAAGWLSSIAPAYLDPFAPPRGPTCSACRGKVLLPERTCEECGGDGICNRCECNHPHDCGYCGGEGDLGPGPCRKCGGEAVEVGPGYFLQNRYVALLRQHGATLRLPAGYTPDRGQETLNNLPAHFTLDGGVEGILMPIRNRRKS